MANNQIARLFEFANLQMTAEAFLLQASDNGVLPGNDVIRARLEEGNAHASRFTPIQATQFSEKYEILAQYRNDPVSPSGSGFSGTLIKNRETGELTLSFRSTEFIDDAVRDAKATGALEIADLGWAFGQIAEMEAWYEQLRADPGLLGDKTFNVTGYSLGGHLATAFNILRREEHESSDTNPVANTYTFNGAGTGQILNNVSLSSLIESFNEIRKDYGSSDEWLALSEGERNNLTAAAQLRLDAIVNERLRILDLSGIDSTAFPGAKAPYGEQATLGYQIATLLVARNTRGVLSANPPSVGGLLGFKSSLVEAPSSMRFQNMVEVVGMEAAGASTSFVSNSGIHYGTRIQVPIEDQPFFRGDFPAEFVTSIFKLLVDNPSQNDFGDTHSLVLLVDSLSLMAALEALDPEFTLEVGQEILDLASRASAKTEVSTQGKAEGDVLERTLDALYKLLYGPNAENALDYKATLDGNTWHSVELRSRFHERLAEVNSAIADLAELPTSSSYSIKSLKGLPAGDLAKAAGRKDHVGVAYRYALSELNPFVVTGGADLYASHNVAGELDVYDPDTGVGVTQAFLVARAEMLAAKNLDFSENGRRVLRSSQSLTYQYVDSGFLDDAGNPLTLTLTGTHRAGQDNPSISLFGSAMGDTLVGGDIYVGDRLFGGRGDDILEGRGGNDYLEGGADHDTLLGGEGADILLGMHGDDVLDGGGGSDVLDGGVGHDSYIYSAGQGVDTILDRDGRGSLRFFSTPSEWFDLTGGKKEADNLWLSEDGRFAYSLNMEADGTQTLVINGNNGTLLVKEFVDEKLGIKLEDAPPPALMAPVGEREIRADLARKVFINPDLSAFPPGSYSSPIISTPSPFDYWVVDELGNFVRDPSRPLEVPESNVLFSGSNASDRLVASVFGNTMIGNGGNDHLLGSTGVDQLGGGDGNDFIEGGAFADIPLEDWLSGVTPFPEGGVVGREDDVLGGGAGDDIIFGGLASDLESLLDAETPAAGHKGDWVSGMEGDDDLYGSTGDDLMLGGHGKDYMVGGPGNDVLNGDDFFFQSHSTFPASAGSAWRVDRGENPFDVRFFPVSVTPLTNYSQTYYKRGGDADILSGGGGDDILIGMLGDDLLMGDDGNDVLSGWEGDDHLLGGNGDDIMAGDFGRDEQPNDRLLGLSNSVPAGFLDLSTADSGPVDLVGNDFLDGGAGRDVLYGEGGDDLLFGGDDADQLWGDAPYLAGEFHGNDYLNGGAGDDELVGGAGDDVLVGGTGDDDLDGGDGADTYIFVRGDGKDFIVDTGESGIDTLFVDGYKLADLVLRQRANGSVVLESGNGDEIFLSFSSGHDSFGIEQVQFSDGTLVTRRDLEVAPIDEEAIGGNEWSSFSEDGESIDASELTRQDGFVMVDAGGGDDVVHGVVDAVIYGGDGNDSITGGFRLLGGNGNDFLAGGTFLSGGNGNDTLVDGAILIGGSGDDALDGKDGADRYLIDPTEPGSDLILDSGGSSDQFRESYYASLGIEDWESLLDVTETRYIVWQGEGPSFDNEDDARRFFESRGFTLEEAVSAGHLQIIAPLPVIPVGGANQYGLLEPFYYNSVIEADQIEFGAGIGINDLVLDWSQDFANLTRDPEGEARLHLSLDISWSAESSIKVLIPRYNDPIGSGIELFSFADGSLYSIADLIGLAPPAPKIEVDVEWVGTNESDVMVGSSLDEEIQGGEGDDRLDGAAGNDQLVGGAGNDTLIGGNGEDALLGGHGDDTYIYDVGGGVDRIGDVGGTDTLVFGGGITPEMLSLGIGSLLIRVGDGGDAIHIEGFDANDVSGSAVIEYFKFADGSTLTHDELMARGFELVGTQGDDVVAGTGVDDRIHGKAGNDLLYGGEGDDTYRYDLGDGFDLIEDTGGEDVIQFGAGIVPADLKVDRNGEVLLLHVDGGELAIRWREGEGDAIERLQFSDGTVLMVDEIVPAAIVGTVDNDEIVGTDGDDWLLGLDGSDILYGEAGNDILKGNEGDDLLSGDNGDDVLDGGAGGDRLEGGMGDDTYVFGRGYGFDDIREAGGDHDVVRFNPDILPSDVLVNRVRDTFYVGLSGTPDRLAIESWLNDDAFRIERFEFANGTVWDFNEIESRVVPAVATEFHDVLGDTDADDVIAGLAGDDEIYADTGNDILFGGEGNDYLEDQAGRNYLSGGNGDDALIAWDAPAFLAGGPGNDYLMAHANGVVVAFNRGDGEDELDAPMLAGMGRFTFSLGGGIMPGDLRLFRDGDSLILRLGGDDSITLNGWYSIDPLGRAALALQIIEDDVSIYDLSALIDAFDAATSSDPEIREWSAGEALSGFLRSVKADQAYGGGIAYHYAVHGSAGMLPTAGGRAVLADESFGLSEQSVVIQQDESRHAPIVEVSIPDVAAQEDAAFHFSVPAGTFSDADSNDELSLSVSLESGDPLPLWLSFDAVAAVFSGTPLQADVGYMDVRLTATDSDGLSVDEVFRLTVENVNDDPVAEADTVSIDEDGQSIVSGDVLLNDSDGDPGTVLTVVDGVYSGHYGVLTIDADGGFAYDLNNASLVVQSLAEGHVVNDVFEYFLTDGIATASGMLKVFIVGANDAPIVANPVADRNVVSGSAFSFEVPIDAFVEIDQGDSLSYDAMFSGGPLPAWLTFDPESRVFSGTPGDGDTGDYSIQISVRDGYGAAASNTFMLTVTDGGGQHLVGTRRDDLLSGGDSGDVIEGLRGDDALRGGLGNDLLKGGRGRDRLYGEAGEDWLQGGAGRDSLFGGAGDDWLKGGRGDDVLDGGYGNDVYVHDRRGGNDVVADAGGQDVLLLGDGITARKTRLYRNQDDLIIDFQGAGGRVTVREWFSTGAQQIEKIQFADGTTWNKEHIGNRLQRGAAPKLRDDDEQDHGHHGGNQRDRDDSVKSGRKQEDGHDEHRSSRTRDRVADLLEAYLAQNPHYDFEVLARDLDRDNDRPNRSLSSFEIADCWQQVSRYVNDLADDRDENSHHGAGVWKGFDAKGLLGIEAGGATGHIGWSGASGSVQMKTLQSLDEGFLHLRG